MTGCPPELTTRREYENWLHAHGFSRSAARRLAAHGWQDAQQDDRDAIKLLRALAARLEIDLDEKNVSP